MLRWMLLSVNRTLQRRALRNAAAAVRENERHAAQRREAGRSLALTGG